MTKQYTIGELGKIIGLPSKTIRYYEEIGLIAPAKRGENGYRLYDEDSKEELQFIKYARDLGIPIETMKKLLNGCVSGDCNHAKEEIEREIDSYIELLTNKIFQLTTLKNKMEHLKGTIHLSVSSDNTKYCCNILHQLSVLKGGE